jgi:hypothetical protein
MHCSSCSLARIDAHTPSVAVRRLVEHVEVSQPGHVATG